MRSRRRSHGKAVVILFEQALRWLAQRLDHPPSILVKHAVRPAVLREGVVQVGANLVELQYKRSFKLLALGGGDRLIGQHGFGFAFGLRDRKSTRLNSSHG